MKKFLLTLVFLMGFGMPVYGQYYTPPDNTWYVSYGTVEATYFEESSSTPGRHSGNFFLVLATDDGKVISVGVDTRSVLPIWLGEHIRFEFGNRDSHTDFIFHNYKVFQVPDSDFFIIASDGNSPFSALGPDDDSHNDNPPRVSQNITPIRKIRHKRRRRHV